MQARSTKAEAPKADSDIDSMSASEEEFAPKPKVGSQMFHCTGVQVSQFGFAMSFNCLKEAAHVH